jgi:hypothetical protein
MAPPTLSAKKVVPPQQKSAKNHVYCEKSLYVGKNNLKQLKMDPKGLFLQKKMPF